jgi:hypothetical protein
MCQFPCTCLSARLESGSAELGGDGFQTVVLGSVGSGNAVGHGFNESVVTEEPLVQTASLITLTRASATVRRATLCASEGHFLVALDEFDSLRNVVSEFARNTSDIIDVFGEGRDADGATENLDVSSQFLAVLDCVAAHGVADVVLDFSAVGVNVSAVNDGLDARRRETVNLPAEVGVLRLGALLCHRGEGGVLRIDERDKVSEFFALTHLFACLELSFGEFSHVSNGLDES